MAKNDTFDPKATTDQASSNDAPGTQEQEQAPVALADQKYVDMPPGGLRVLAGMLYPDDRDTPDAMMQHVADLLALNSDRLRNQDSYTVGTQVRIV